MNADTAQRILDLNRQFYQTFAAEFSATRQRLQPGVRRLLERIPAQARLLDLGCGNGELWRALARSGHRGGYLGVDFSPRLLEHAASASGAPGAARFLALDLAAPDWAALRAHAPFDLAVCFATLHHIPGGELRARVLRNLRACLADNAQFFLSNWQFLNSPRLAARIQPWERAGLHAEQVDAGDYLLDWRQGGEGLRYVHHFTADELAGLAAACGFRVLESFLSDGEGGRLGLYQIWERTPEL